MKKIITFTALFISSLGIYTAQSYSDNIHVGVKGGINYSNAYDSQGEQFQADPKMGVAFGGFVSIPIGTLLGIQPEILFSQKGFEGKGRILAMDYSFKRTTSFLDIPLLVAVKPLEAVTLYAGPQFSYLLSKKDEFTSSLVTVEQEQEFENENIRKNTLGAAVGLDINIDHFVLGLRANWDLQENRGDGTSTTPRYKNQWLQATVGIRF